MKLDARQIAGFLRDPGAARLVLLYGEDEGLVRDRAQALTRQVAGSLNDPFRMVELTREGWDRIAAEMTALSMIGGRRVILVRDAGDAILSRVAEAMAGRGDALLILEAVGLGRGKLRSYAEASTDGVAIACYPEEGQALAALITRSLTERSVTADPDALSWLAQSIGGDRAVVQGEIEKLALLAGPGGRVDMEMARACVGEAAASAGEDGLLAATLGDLVGSDIAIGESLANGLNGVALLRMALGHLQRLHQARLRMQAGATAGEAVRLMRPPVFYKATSSMTTALGLWSTDLLWHFMEEARQAELACKQTGGRPELLARRFVQLMARTARAQRARAA